MNNKIKLGSVLKIMHGYAFKSENYVDQSQYRLITLGNFEEGGNCFKFNNEKATYYGADFPKIFIMKKGDLIMPLTEQVVGLFGNSAFVPATDEYKFVLNQRVGKVTCDETKVDKYYIHYLLATESVKNQLEARASGTRQRNISPDDVYDVEVFMPELSVQKKIGGLLFNIEQKQLTNNTISSTLESLAKLIYDYWFVQFDFPDENGKPYKSSGGKMVWNEELKREIPKGWKVGNLLKYVNWESNSQPPKCEFIYGPRDGYVRFIQNRDYDSNSYKTYIPFKKNLSIVSELDILMDKYGDAGRVRYGIAGAFNVALGKIRPQAPFLQEYIRSFLESKSVYTYLHNSCMASTRASLSEANLATLNIVIPPDDVSSSYQEEIVTIRKFILRNNKENELLSALRDFLLPMLMNGQVTIKD